jgi:hypothetical protein
VLAYGAVFALADDTNEREQKRPNRTKEKRTPPTTGTSATAPNSDATATIGQNNFIEHVRFT